MDSGEQQIGFATKAIHIAMEPDELASDKFNNSELIDQIARCTLQRCLATLENSKCAVIFGSGMAAITAVFNLLRPGQHVIIHNDVYDETEKLVRFFPVNGIIDIRDKHQIHRFDAPCFFEPLKHIRVYMRPEQKEVYMGYGIEFTFTNILDPRNVDLAIKPCTKMVFFETPTNPMLRVIDIQAIARITHQQPGALLVVDNTLMTPYFQRPLLLGADISVASLSQYVSGDPNVTMGVVATNCKTVFKRLRLFQSVSGCVPSISDCQQMIKSITCLQLRMDKHAKNALCVARFLEGHQYVEKVHYPGLKSHPENKIHRSQCLGSSGIVSFYIKGRLTNTWKFARALKLFQVSLNFGAPKCLVELPFIMAHATLSEQGKKQAGIKENLVRLSVGLEDIEDIVADLDEALTKSQK